MVESESERASQGATLPGDWIMTTALFRRLLVPALTLLGAGIVPLAAQEAQPRPDPRYVAKARADSARYPYTEADVHFMQGMTHHHAQALVMAGWASSHEASPAVLTLCGRIINAQNDEIRFMQMGLRDRNQDVPPPAPGPVKMKMAWI